MRPFEFLAAVIAAGVLSALPSSSAASAKPVQDCEQDNHGTTILSATGVIDSCDRSEPPRIGA